MKIDYLRWCGFFLILCGAASVAPARKIANKSLYEIVKESDSIFVARTASQMTDLVQVEILSVLKGSVSPKALAWPSDNGSDIHVPRPLPPGSTYIAIFRNRQSYVLQLSPEYYDRNMSLVRKLISVGEMTIESERDHAMFELVTSTNQLLQQTASQYIWRISTDALHGPYHADVVKLLKSDIPAAQSAAFTAIRHTKDKEFLRLAREAAKSKNDQVVEAASLVLSDDFSAEATNTLIALTKHSSERVRSRAAIDLRDRRRNGALPVIIGLLKDASPKVREYAAGSLVSWYRYGEGLSSVPQLIEMLGDADENVRMSAAYSLGESGDPKAVSALLKVLEKKPANERVEYRVLQSLEMLRSPRRTASIDKATAALFNSYYPCFVEVIEKHRSGALYAVSLVAASDNAGARVVLERAAREHPDQSVRESAKWYLVHKTVK